MKLSATVKEAVADCEVTISQEAVAHAGPPELSKAGASNWSDFSEYGPLVDYRARSFRVRRRY